MQSTMHCFMPLYMHEIKLKLDWFGNVKALKCVCVCSWWASLFCWSFSAIERLTFATKPAHDKQPVFQLHFQPAFSRADYLQARRWLEARSSPAKARRNGVVTSARTTTSSFSTRRLTRRGPEGHWRTLQTRRFSFLTRRRVSTVNKKLEDK